MPSKPKNVKPGAALSGRALPRPGAGANRGNRLGRTASLGALGTAPSRAGKGLAAKPTRPGAALSGRPATVAKAKPSNVRPRAGRGVNPALALAGHKHYETADRLAALKKKLGGS